MTSVITAGKCRVCTCSLATKDKSYDMVLLPLVAHKFVTCTNLTFSEEERLPSQLCQLCYDQLEQLYAFRSKCIAADEQWRLELATCEDAEKSNHNMKRKNSTSVEVLGLQECSLRIVRKWRPKHVFVEAKREKETEPNPNPKYKPYGDFRCNICDRSLRFEHCLVAHKRQHEGLAPYPCTEIGCHMAFKDMYKLSEHQKKRHSGIKRLFTCDQEGCNKSFSSKPSWQMHRRAQHKLGTKLPSHVCEFCGKVFHHKYALNSHRYTHMDKSNSPHACPEANCLERKTTKDELQLHLKSHALARSFPCRICPQVCTTHWQFKMHVRTAHQGTSVYACNFCEERFDDANSRRCHEMMHTGEKPHKCEECGIVFRQANSLRLHRKTHQRERQETNKTDDNPRVLAVGIPPATEKDPLEDLPLYFIKRPKDSRFGSFSNLPKVN